MTKRSFAVGDRVAVILNGYSVARGTVISLPTTPDDCYTIHTDLDVLHHKWAENLRHLRPKPKRDVKILEEALEYIADPHAPRRTIGTHLDRHYEDIAAEALNMYRGTS